MSVFTFVVMPRLADICNVSPLGSMTGRRSAAVIRRPDVATFVHVGRDEQPELVATQSRGGDALGRLRHDPRHLDDHLVAAGVAERLVHLVELVEVEHGQDRAGRCLGDELAQAGAVGEAGERVGERQPLELCADVVQLGQVLQHECRRGGSGAR